MEKNGNITEDTPGFLSGNKPTLGNEADGRLSKEAKDGIDDINLRLAQNVKTKTCCGKTDCQDHK